MPVTAPSTLGLARAHYTTADSVQDMEAIRAELGVDKLTLFGISYGTELAIQYARTYPQHVERLILDSVVDPDDTDPYFTSRPLSGGGPLRRSCMLTQDPSQWWAASSTSWS